MNTSDSIFKPKKAKKAEPVAAAPVAMPAKAVVINKWPKDNDMELSAAFGNVSENHYTEEGLPNRSWETSFLQKLELPYAMRLAWNKDVLVRQIAVNRLIYQSLANILHGIFDLYGRDMKKIQEARMDLYGGCYNFRPRRGGHRLSLHAWGAAIDIDPENNPLGKKWEADKGMMPKEVIEIFLNQGWKWGGTFSNPDAQHFEATS